MTMARRRSFCGGRVRITAKSRPASRPTRASTGSRRVIRENALCCSPGSACCASRVKSPARWAKMPLAAWMVVREALHCLALIEIIESCNLACPVCYADSLRDSAVAGAKPLDELQARIQGVIDRKGVIDILQLSGGEPTLHPQFFELLAWRRRIPAFAMCS